MIPLIIMGAMALGGAMGKKGEAKAAETTAKSNAKVQNILREARNQVEGAQTSLSRYMQSRQNQVMLENAGDAIDATTGNILRFQESTVLGGVSRRIQAAEDAGALFARQSAIGVRGNTADVLRATSELRRAQIEQQITRQEEQQDFGLRQQREQQVDAMILGLDLSPVIDNINQFEVQAQKINVPSTGQVVGQAAMQFAQAYAAYGGLGSTRGEVNLQGQAAPLTNNPAFVRNM